MGLKQVLWGRNCFEVEEIQPEWETQAEVPELTWWNVLLWTESEKVETVCKMV